MTLKNVECPLYSDSLPKIELQIAGLFQLMQIESFRN